jgi:hypothetical protein
MMTIEWPVLTDTFLLMCFFLHMMLYTVVLDVQPWYLVFFQLTKETTVQATGVASNLVEAIQGAGFKLQTLSLSFDDFDEAKTGVGGGVQPSE